MRAKTKKVEQNHNVKYFPTSNNFNGKDQPERKTGKEFPHQKQMMEWDGGAGKDLPGDEKMTRTIVPLPSREGGNDAILSKKNKKKPLRPNTERAENQYRTTLAQGRPRSLLTRTALS